MQLSFMTVSIPIDTETLDEIKGLLEEAKENYTSLLSIDGLMDSFLKGFCVLVYDDEKDKLVGVLTASDRMATGDYEWSAFVSPSVRRQGIGQRLLMELNHELEIRGAVYDLALVFEEGKAGQHLLRKNGYFHDFSERTMVADANVNFVLNDVEILLFSTEESEVVAVLVNAFGDSEDEAKEMIAFTTATPNRRLMIAKLEGKIVGTVSIIEESDKLWVTGLAVHETARGQGVATTILNWTKKEAFDLGKAHVYLDVETDNDKALSLYEKVGFELINHTKFYTKHR